MCWGCDPCFHIFIPHPSSSSQSCSASTGGRVQRKWGKYSYLTRSAVMSSVTCCYCSLADWSVWQVSKQRLSCRTPMYVLAVLQFVYSTPTLCFCTMQYNYISTIGNILHPLTARFPMFLMLVWSCSLGWCWHGDSKSPSLESMEPQESQPLLPHQVVGINLFEVSILHPTIFLQPSYSFLKEALGGSKLHHISSCLSREGVQVSPP